MLVKRCILRSAAGSADANSRPDCSSILGASPARGFLLRRPSDGEPPASDRRPGCFRNGRCAQISKPASLAQHEGHVSKLRQSHFFTPKHNGGSLPGGVLVYRMQVWSALAQASASPTSCSSKPPSRSRARGGERRLNTGRRPAGQLRNACRIPPCTDHGYWLSAPSGSLRASAADRSAWRRRAVP